MLGQSQIVVGGEVESLMQLALGILDADLRQRSSQQLSFLQPELVLVQLVDELLRRIISGEKIGALGVGELLNELMFGVESERGGEGGK